MAEMLPGLGKAKSDMFHSMDGIDAETQVGQSCRSRVADWALLIWGSPVGAAVAAGLVYALICAQFAPRGLGQSAFPYFAYLADAFLHGQLALIEVPNNTKDLVYYQGQYYLYWPPFPAIVFVPSVLALGVGASDAPVNIISAALNVGLVSMLIAALQRRGLAILSREKRAWLIVFFAFGTVHMSLAPYPQVWYIAQLVAFGLTCAAYLTVLTSQSRWALIVSGSLLGLAFLSRTSTIFSMIWILWYLWNQKPATSCMNGRGSAVIVMMPAVVAVGIQGMYNWLRFGSPMDMGMAYHLMHPFFQESFQSYGLFSLHYVAVNLYYNFIFVPYVALAGANPGLEFFMGGSVFLMSPVFFLGILGVLRTWRTHGRALSTSYLLGLVPMLLLMGTGWVQFGPRYTLDATVPLLVATCIGAEGVKVGTLRKLTLISMILYLPGTALLGLYG